MSNFIGKPHLKFAMGWHRNHAISHSPNQFFLRTPSFPIQGVPMNNLAPMKNCPGGVQGNLNWLPGYIICLLFIVYSFRINALAV